MFNVIQNERSRVNHHKLAVLIVPLVALSVVTQLYLLLPVVDILNHSMGTQSSLTGLLTTAFGGFYAAGFLVWGLLSDKYGREKIMIRGLFALATVTVLIALQCNFYIVLALRCAQGFIASSFPPVVLAWVAENFAEKTKRVLISLLSCSFLLAGTLGQLYGSLMIDKSIEKSMLFLGLVYFLGAVFFILSSQNGKQKRKSVKKEISVMGILKMLIATLSDRYLSRIYLSSLFVLMSFVSLYFVFLSEINTGVLNNVDVNLLRTVATLGMLTCLFSGKILQHFAPAKALSLSLVIIAISSLCQYLLITNNDPTAYIIYTLHFMFACAISLAVPSMIYCVTIHSKLTNRGVAVSIYTCILFIGASLGSFLPAIINNAYFFPVLSFGLLGVSIAAYSLKK